MLSKNGIEFGKYCAVHWRRAHRQETVKSLHVTEIGLSTDSAWATLARDTCIPGDFTYYRYLRISCKSNLVTFFFFHLFAFSKRFLKVIYLADLTKTVQNHIKYRRKPFLALIVMTPPAIYQYSLSDFILCRKIEQVFSRVGPDIWQCQNIRPDFRLSGKNKPDMRQCSARHAG